MKKIIITIMVLLLLACLVLGADLSVEAITKITTNVKTISPIFKDAKTIDINYCDGNCPAGMDKGIKTDKGYIFMNNAKYAEITK